MFWVGKSIPNLEVCNMQYAELKWSRLSLQVVNESLLRHQAGISMLCHFICMCGRKFPRYGYLYPSPADLMKLFYSIGLPFEGFLNYLAGTHGLYCLPAGGDA